MITFDRNAHLAGCAAGAALAAMFYLPARGFWPLLAVSLAQASALAPLAPLCDSLVLAAAGARRYGFDYGWVRGAGSGAFILGTVLSGQMVGYYGLAAVIWLNAGLLAAVALYAPTVPRLPPLPAQASPTADPRYGIPALLHIPAFRRIVLVAALILGSHALHDGFAVIRWTAAGIGPGTAGLLWSESVAAEVIVFLFVGWPLLDRLGPAGAATLAAVAGIVRWTVSAETAWLPAVALIQPLHGITFALLHAPSRRNGAASAFGDSVDAVRHGRDRRGVGAADARLRLALWRCGSGWVLVDGCIIHRRAALRAPPMSELACFDAKDFGCVAWPRRDLFKSPCGMLSVRCRSAAQLVRDRTGDSHPSRRVDRGSE